MGRTDPSSIYKYRSVAYDLRPMKNKIQSKDIHLLMLPSWYGISEEPLNGFFFKDQALAWHKAGVKVGVVYPEIRQLRRMRLSSLIDNHFQSASYVEDGLPTMRLHGWNLFPKCMKGQMLAWSFFAGKLVDRYVSQHGKPDLIHCQSAV